MDDVGKLCVTVRFINQIVEFVQSVENIGLEMVESSPLAHLKM